MTKKRSERKTQPGKTSRKANQPKKQSATRTVKPAATWIYVVHRIIRKQSDSHKFTGSQALAEARAYFEKVKADPFVDTAWIERREVNGKPVVVEIYPRPLKTRSLPPCPACGRERGTVDEEHPDFQTDLKEDCWDCRSPRGKVAEIAIEIEAAERYDSASFKPALFPDWPTIAHHAGKRFGHDLTDAQLLECIKNWYIAENGGDINSLLGMKLVELAQLLKAAKRPPTTVAKLAARWGCKNHTVLALIHTGQLRAFKLRPGAKRPTWRIREEEVEAYERGDADEFERGELKKPKARRQRRKKQDPTFVKYC